MNQPAFSFGFNSFPPVTIARKEDACEMLRAPNYGDFKHVVSIGEPMSPKPWFLTEDVGFSLLRLEFDDISYDPPTADPDCPNYVAPNQRHIQDLIGFMATVKGPLLCHCAAGISRSAAAAIVYLAMRMPAGKEDAVMEYIKLIRPQAHPNKRMVALIDRLLGRNGNILRAAFNTFYPGAKGWDEVI